jgi:hypothetical protein
MESNRADCNYTDYSITAGEGIPHVKTMFLAVRHRKRQTQMAGLRRETCPLASN